MHVVAVYGFWRELSWVARHCCWKRDYADSFWGVLVLSQGKKWWLVVVGLKNPSAIKGVKFGKN